MSISKEAFLKVSAIESIDPYGEDCSLVVMNSGRTHHIEGLPGDCWEKIDDYLRDSSENRVIDRYPFIEVRLIK